MSKPEAIGHTSHYSTASYTVLEHHVVEGVTFLLVLDRCTEDETETYGLNYHDDYGGDRAIDYLIDEMSESDPDPADVKDWTPIIRRIVLRECTHLLPNYVDPYAAADRSERLMMAGMGGGCRAYNEAAGYDLEDPDEYEDYDHRRY